LSMEWWRDLVIIIFGIGVTAVLVILGVIAILCYRRVRLILDSMRVIAKTAENISSCVEEELIKPLSQLAAFIQGINKAASMMGRFCHKKGE
jgi:hypothetical protein